MESKPTSSAVRTIRSSVGAISVVPPGYVNESTWSPNFTPRSVRRAPLARCAPDLAEQVERFRHHDVADRALATGERGASHEGHRAPGALAERQLRGGRELVGEDRKSVV